MTDEKRLASRDGDYFATALKEHLGDGWTQISPVTYGFGETSVKLRKGQIK